MITVIIPLFNKRPYLLRALDSVYAQTSPVDEIVIVNDGSTDGGDAIAKAQRDPRVRVIDQPNQGVSAARNAGIESAKQPYVAFLDADDLWLPGFLARIKEMLETSPGAALYGTGFATVADGREIRRYGVREKVFKHKGTGGRRWGCERPVFGPVDFFKVWSHGHVIHTSSTVVPRQAALDVGGFPEGVTHGEDLEFWAKLALRGTVVLSPDILTHYHVDVPGQAVEYWEGAYKRDFEVLPYHRFLALKMAEILSGTTKITKGTKCGFLLYCRREFLKGLLQRLYWGDMEAFSRFYHELQLNRGGYGTGVEICAWMADHPVCYPFVCSLARIARQMRQNSESPRAK